MSKSAPICASVACACGKTRLAVAGEPILVSECLCDSCRTAAKRLAALPGGPNMLTTYGATPFAEYRKDRVRILAGEEGLRAFRLSPEADTRRIVASCCNTPIFLEMKGAHWLSLYLGLWPREVRPRPELRTMVGDLPDASGLPDDIPNLKTHSVTFYMKLLSAWIRMGFRNPTVRVEGQVDA
ncbi:DUF6151 family protein [Caulobacter sp. SL161]|uniref:GFA family protein n=1 Tax=Caulobacter sp. SL161 TaxID=2995156 RepID=UPI00227238CC|nr:DUF6151 family protein [Caulobacter sp. SL161]MCY1648498.1 DUF6151 family protein [Caulobacter sp. SL161]